MSAPDILAAALWLQARHGMHVFAVDHPGLPECAGAHRRDQPCDGKRGKHPMGKWSRDATVDPDVIRAALSRGLRNVGIACGPSGLLLVDEDRPGAFGEYAAGVDQALPETFTVDTGRGRHFYFRAPDGPPLGNSPGALAGRGIDIRGRGGFVVAPGSIHETGVIYSPVDPTVPILPAPEWLVSALRSPRPRPPAPSAPRAKVTGARPHRVLTGLVQTVLDATPELDRNSRLFWAGCRMYEHAGWGLFDQTAGRDALRDAARHVGLSDGEIDKTLDSAAERAGSRL